MGNIATLHFTRTSKRKLDSSKKSPQLDKRRSSEVEGIPTSSISFYNSLESSFLGPQGIQARDRGFLQTTSLNKSCSVGLY